MERSEGSVKTAACRRVMYLLLMLTSGLFFCSLLTMLAYFSYQAIVGNVRFCSLWIDVPGRLAVFFTCYYIASMCGFFPLPERYRINSFMEPFKVWSLESWRDLYRNMCFPTPSLGLIIRLQRNSVPVQDTSESPLLQENNRERIDNGVSIKKPANPISITYPESYVAPVFVSHSESPLRNESPEINKSLDGSLTSIDSSLGGIIVPMMKGKSSKPHYLSESSIRESPDDRVGVSSIHRKRYSEIKWTGEDAADARVPVLDDNVFVPVARECPLDKKSAEIAENELITINRQRPLKEMSNVRTTDERFRLPTGNELLPKTNDHPRIQDRNLKSGGITANKRKIPPKLHSTETQFNFPRIRDRNQQPDGATADSERKTPPSLRNTEAPLNFQGIRDRNQEPGGATADSERKTPPNTETQLNFPRFPWCYFRNPKGIPTLANKLHKRNLELEKREMKKYCNKQRRRVDLERLLRSLITDIRNELVTETQLPRSSQNINVIAKNPFRIKSSSTVAVERSDEQTQKRYAIESVISKDNVDQTANRSDLLEKYEKGNRNSGHATSRRRLLHSRRQEVENVRADNETNRPPPPPYSQKSNLTQRQEAENMNSTNRCRPIFSQRQEVENMRADYETNRPPPPPYTQTFDLTQRQEMESMKSTNRCRPLFSQRPHLTQGREVEYACGDYEKNRPPPPPYSQKSDLTQRQEMENMSLTAGPSTNRRCLLPSQRLQVKVRSRSRSQIKTENTDFKLEIHRRNDQRDSELRTLSEAGPSNLPKFKQDAERTDLLEPETEKIANERLQTEELKKRQKQFGQGTQPTDEVSAALEFEQNIDAISRDTVDSNISAKLNEDEIAISSSTNKSGNKRL